jgi:hypothetical protein
MKLDKILAYSFAVSLVVNTGVVSFLGYSRLLHPETSAQANAGETAEPLQFGIFHLPRPAPTPTPMRDPRRSPMKLSEAIARGTFVGKGDDDDDDDEQPLASRSATPQTADDKKRPGKGSAATAGSGKANGDGRTTSRSGNGSGNSGRDGASGAGSTDADGAASSNEDANAARGTGRLGAEPVAGEVRTAMGVPSSGGDRGASKNVPGGVSDPSKRDRRGAKAATSRTTAKGRTVKDGAESGDDGKDSADVGDALLDKTPDGKAAAGTFVMPKMAKMWSVPPGQKIVLPRA